MRILSLVKNNNFSHRVTYSGFLPVSLANESIINPGMMWRRKHKIVYSILLLDILNKIGEI